MPELQMNKFTVQELADFYQKLADGSKIDYALLPKDSFGHPENGPHLGCSKDVWRIKPTHKVIDLSVLIESGIDCEFKDSCDKKWHVSKADKGLYQESLYGTKSGDYFEQCQPRMNHIHAWQGGECPLPEGFMVKVCMRDDSVRGDMCSHFNWKWSYKAAGSDIIQFEVLGLADGYVMPWEQGK